MWNKIKSSPFFRHAILAFATVVLLIFGTLMWLNSYTLHGEKIETPNFLGLTLSESQKLAKENGLRLSIDSVYSSKPLNSVILQNPVPHSDTTESWVKTQRIIYLTLVRSTKQKIKLPAIIDNSKSLASTKLTIAGLSPQWEYETSPYKDVVLDVKYKGVSVKDGFLLEKESMVTVVVGKGQGEAAQVSIPNLVGKTISEANLELTNKNFLLVPVYNCQDCKTAADSASAVIEQQTPEFVEGMTISEGSEIIIILTK
ncbi:MAG: PASTA domain-containing protein [Flavobacteriales bacterium]